MTLSEQLKKQREMLEYRKQLDRDIDKELVK